MVNAPRPSPSVDGRPAASRAALTDFWYFARLYWRAERRRAWGFSLALGATTLAHALLQLRLNIWFGDFFNALDLRAGGAILGHLAIFTLLVLGLMAAAAAQIYLKMALQIGWRRWITHRLIGRWLHHDHSYVLRFKGNGFDNPDYRIAEDVRLVTEGAVDFATGLLNSALLLVIFLGVLWNLSAVAGFAIGDFEFAVPGYLVLVAVAYAAMTTTLTHLLGQPLVKVSEDLHAREGDFRYDLVRLRDSAEGVAFLRGEADERRHLDRLFGRLAGTWRLLMRLQTRLTWATAGFTVITPVVPLLIGASFYLEGRMTLGELIQASQAFVQVQLALGFFVDNYARLSDWFAGIHRIVRLSVGLVEIERVPRRITTKLGAQGTLRLDHLDVDNPDGTLVIDGATAVVRQGERVLVTGESGIGKTMLFRALAGLWPWGSGTIELPPDAHVLFVPHHPYAPPGSLRAVLAYPERPERYDNATLTAALRRCGLHRIVEQLDVEARWDQALSDGEQQRLAFARLLLHKPDWVVMDEATSELEESTEAELMALFENELDGTTLVSLSERASLRPVHGRTLTLVRGETAANLVETISQRAATSEAGAS